MPPAGVIAICALGAITYLYAVQPIVHVVKKVSHVVCRVATAGHECAAKKKN